MKIELMMKGLKIMTTEKMSVHEALCELKTLDDRIEKIIDSNKFVFSNKHSNTKVSGVDIKEYCKEIKSKYQSANDLIARRDALKRAVTLSNATTKVRVGDMECTVAEAIEMKNHGIPILQKLLDKLDADNKKARFEAESSNGINLERRADEYIRSMYENKDLKDISAEMKKAREAFIAAQTTEVVNPIGVIEEMEKLNKRINSFVVKIDSALSVSNALKEIEIKY